MAKKGKGIASALKGYGGKFYQAQWIISEFPKKYINFVETHFLTGAVMFACEPSNVAEHANDLDKTVMTFWRVLKSPTLFSALKEYLEKTPFSVMSWNDANDILANPTKHDEVALAASLFIQIRQSRQAARKSFATMTTSRLRRGMNEQVSAWLSSILHLDEVHKRLQTIVLHNEDANTLIPKLDDKVTFFYLDPPYHPATRASKQNYRHDMTHDDHKKLLDTLCKIKGKFMISGYPHSLYEEYARQQKWRSLTMPIDNKASSKKVKDIKTETIWMNY